MLSKITLCDQFMKVTISTPSIWRSVRVIVPRPISNCSQISTMMPISEKLEFIRMRLSVNRRCSRIVAPTSATAPAMPPISTAIHCFTA